MSVSTRVIAACCLLLLALALTVTLNATKAEAHGVLLRSEPLAGATLDESPKTLELWFSEGLAADLTKVRVVDANGEEAAPVTLTYNPADDKQVSVSLPELKKGTYAVAWSSFSTVDGHRLDGSFAFGVGVAPEGPASTTSAPDFAPSAREVGSRWVHLIGLLGVAGVFVVALLAGPPKPGEAHPLSALVLLGVAASGLAVLGDVGSLLVRADRAGGMDQLGEVVSGSNWGTAWVWRIALSLTALVMLAAMARLRARWYRRLAVLALLLTAGAMLTESTGSHAAARDGGLPVFADFVHLLASAAWIGTVIGLAVASVWSRRDPSGKRRAVIAEVVRRFAVVAVFSFGIVLLTGVYRTVQEVPTLRAFVDTTYGKALTAKLLLVILVLALGGTNFLLVRRWWRERTTRAWQRVLRSLPAEAVVGTAILAAVALLTVATPAASLDRPLLRGDSSDIASVVRQRAAAGDLEVELTVAPADGGRVGVAATFVRTQSTRDRPFTGEGLGITQVRFRFKPADGSIGEARVIAAREGDDEAFAVEGPYLPFRGAWNIQVDVRRRGTDDVSASFQYDTEADQRPAWVRVLSDDALIFSVAQSTVDPSILVAAGNEGGVYRSDDGGLTWKQANGTAALRIIARPAPKSDFLMVGGYGVYRSTDLGMSWTPLRHEQGNRVWDIISSGDTVVVATESGVLTSLDDGETWQLTLPTPPPPPGDATQPDQWGDLATGPSGLMLAGRRPGVLAVSRDGGRSWEETKPSGLNLPGGVMSLLIDPADENRWFVGSMGGGVWTSDDGGTSWRQVTNGVSVNGHGAAFAIGADGDTLVATTGQGVLSTENGLDWTPVGDDAIESAIAEDVFVLRQDDGGQTLIVGGIGIYRLELSPETAATQAR